MTVAVRGGLVWANRIASGAVVLLCLAPLVAAALPLLRTPVQTAAEVGELFGSARLWGLWGKTCAIAVCTALISTALGAPLGLLLARFDSRRSRWLAALLTAPLLLPSHVLALAWVDLFGQQGLVNDVASRLGLAPPTLPLYAPAGVVLVQSLSFYPLALWSAWIGARQIDPAVLDAARNLGSRVHALRRVVLPLLYPSLATGALMAFLFSLLSFTVPSLLQVPVFTVEIYTSFNSLLDQRRAVLMALPLALSGVALFWMAAGLFRRATRGATRTARPLPPPMAWPAMCIAVAVALVNVALPLGALAARSMPPATFFNAAVTGLEELGATLLLAVSGATLTLLVAVAVTSGAARQRTWPLWSAALAYLVSGPVFGVGLIQLWNRPGLPGYFYDHFAILLLAVAGRYLVFALLGCRLARSWVPEETLEAARTLGASSWRTLVTVVLPPLRRVLLAIWACLALLIMGEIECIVLVAPPGWVPVSLRIFTLMHYGPAAMVSALALVQAGLALALLALVRILVVPDVYTPRKSGYHRARDGSP